jgi:hypothetical protein
MTIYVKKIQENTQKITKISHMSTQNVNIENNRGFYERLKYKERGRDIDRFIKQSLLSLI